MLECRSDPVEVSLVPEGQLPRFVKDFSRLSRGRQLEFIAVVEKFVADLQAGQGFRLGLRVKGVQGSAGLSS